MNAAEKDLLRRLFEDWKEIINEHCADNNMDWPQHTRDFAAEIESALEEPTHEIESEP